MYSIKQDEFYMQQALDLSKQATGYVDTNPLVGCVIVRDGQILAKGYHHKYGDLHAERDAIKNAPTSLVGATAYVTLEPCCHQGKQPPCTDALIEAGIAKVVVAASDPNPKVAGKGLKLLREAGIEVVTGVLEQQALELNEVFIHYIQKNQPFIALKYAMTIDGKIATSTGASKWITGEEARAHVHQLRHAYSAIMVGIGTVLADDPLLTARFDGAINPTRIIIDSKLRMPLNSQIVQTAQVIPTIVVTTSTDQNKIKALQVVDIEVLQGEQDHVDLSALMPILGDKGINSILVEGGASLNGALVKAGLVNKVYSYVAPKIFGGQHALSPIGATGISLPSEALQLEVRSIKRFGTDILIESGVL